MTEVNTRPVLLSQEDIGYHTDDSDSFLPIDHIEPIIEERQQNPVIPNGVREAARVLLTEDPVIIRFVDSTSAAEPSSPHRLTYEPSSLLAFKNNNPEIGGDFKMHINRYVDGQDLTEYAIWTPPNLFGAAVNSTFHRVSLDESSHTERLLKAISSQADVAGLSSKGDETGVNKYFLFGSPLSPFEFSRLVENLGFEFTNNPYSQEQSRELFELSRAAEAQFDYHEMREWPAHQYAAQVLFLGGDLRRLEPTPVQA